MKYRAILFFFCLLALGCGKKPDPAPDPTPEPKPPTGATTKAVLLLPLKNEVCYTGTIFSAAMSEVTFKWTESASVESYTIVVTNLTTGNSFVQTPIKATQTTMGLARNTPYSWLIKTKSSIDGAVLESETWKFYNAGDGVAAYAPYPADLLTPTLGQNVTATAGKVTLTWTSSDPDGDISKHEVYFGTASNPPIVSASHTSASYQVNVASGTKYYWKIVTIDVAGNTSTSAIYHFTVL